MLLVERGRTDQDVVLRDIWMLDVERGIWNEASKWSIVIVVSSSSSSSSSDGLDSFTMVFTQNSSIFH